MIVEKNGAEVNLELVERLAEREQRDWTYFGRLRHETGEEASRSTRCAVRGRPPAAAVEEAPGTATWNSAKPSSAFLASVNATPLRCLVFLSEK